MRKVLVVGGHPGVVAMFELRGWEVTQDLTKADLVQFTGGADVSPAIYGEPNSASHCDWARDLHEAGVFALALRMGLPMAGICRGGQFLNVMSGGKMHQHVEGHAEGNTHWAYTADNRKIRVSSTHHQIMQPDFAEAQLLLHGEESVFPDVAQVEAVYYPNTNALCFQPHPEFQNVPECTDLYFEFIYNYLLNEVTDNESVSEQQAA